MSIEVLTDGAIDAEVLPPDFEPHLKALDSSKGTAIFPAPVVEGMLAECLIECKLALDTVCDIRVAKKNRTKMIHSCYKIFYLYVHNAKERLEPYSEASLNIKHRLCRRILREMETRLAENDVTTIKRHTNKKAIKFAKDATEFLSAMHVALREDSERNERFDAQEGFCGEG
jgi:hypothetical protein